MTDNPGLLLTIAAFVLVIGPLVFFHELGHYLVGRWFDVKAETFSIGFGPEIGGWTDKRGTRWRIAAVPLGGYVRFAGDANAASEPDAEWQQLPPAERARTLHAKPVWQRSLIMAAGSAANFLLAIIVLAGFALAYGESRTPAVAQSFVEGSAAQRDGVKLGDRVVAIGGRSVKTFEDMAMQVQHRPNELLALDLLRDGDPVRVLVTTGVEVQHDRFGNEFRLGRLGIVNSEPVIEPVGLLEAPVVATRKVVAIVRMTIDALVQIVTGRRSVKELGGPIKIAKYSGEQIVSGPEAFILFIAMISINLGFINLLPVPMLDGGHLLFYAIEAVRRKPVSIVAQEWAYRSGLLALLALMVFVTFNDLAQLGTWSKLSALIG